MSCPPRPFPGDLVSWAHGRGRRTAIVIDVYGGKADVRFPRGTGCAIDLDRLTIVARSKVDMGRQPKVDMGRQWRAHIAGLVTAELPDDQVACLAAILGAPESVEEFAAPRGLVSKHRENG